MKLKNIPLYAIYALGRILKGSDKADEIYLKMLYKYYLKKKCDLKNPKTYNEKIQWLKIYDKKPIYTQMVDKYEVRKIVTEQIGEEYLIPCLGVWDRFDEIDFDKLPNQFVLKCTHDSGGLVICRDKSKLDIAAAKKKIEHCLGRNYYLNLREWPYKDVKPRIIAEQYMEDTNVGQTRMYEGLTDYKFYCFDGKPRFLYISQGLEDHSTARISFVELDWKFAPYVRKDYKPFDVLPEKPFSFDEMIKLSEQLSKGYPFLRVDLYEIDKKVYFSEFTFSPCSGFMPFKETKHDLEIGNMIVLPQKDKS